MRFKAVIFDLDNTIYDWYAAFLPAFYDMIRVATPLLNYNSELLLNEIRNVHIRHRDVEHPFSLMETDTVKSLISDIGETSAWKKLDPAFHSFNRTRKANLKLFPGVIGTLRYLRKHHIVVIAYTDSTYYAARGRVERLGLLEMFDKIYCRERGSSTPPSQFAKVSKELVEKKFSEIPSHESKPNPRVLLDIVRDNDFEVHNVAYVGDSIAKDIVMAKKTGCFSVWAKYGTFTDSQMYKQLIRISHWTTEDIARERNYAVEANEIIPDFVCEHSLYEFVEFIRDCNHNNQIAADNQHLLHD